MKTAVILLTYGSPNSLDDVEPYLRRVMCQRPPTPDFVATIRERYARIGGRSPLMDISRRQASLLQAALDLPVFVGTLHGEPTISEAVARAQADPIIGICATPHYAPITADAYRAALLESAPTATFIASWHQEPALLDTWAGRVANKAPFVLFTAHSIPIEHAEPYPTQLRETIDGIVSRTGGLSWALAYQSRSTRRVPWLGPDVETQLDKLSATGVHRLLVAPIGFVTDNVEILYDLDVLHAEQARQREIEWSRTPMLNTDPLLITAMATAVKNALP